MNTRLRLALAGGLGLAAAAGVELALARPPVPARPVNRRSNMDEPLRLIAAARQEYARVQDYACTLIKRERLNGQLQPDHIMTMRVRTQPFSVYLKWHEPKGMTGQEVCYVEGRNDGKMRVKPSGLLGAVGFVSIDPTDPRAQQTSRRNITQAGIGNLIERIARGWEAERQRGKAIVRTGEYEYNKRRCTRVETINPTRMDDQVQCYRSVIYFDKELHLPIRCECYDWPKNPQDAGELMDVYSFVNLKVNVGLGEELFNK